MSVVAFDGSEIFSDGICVSSGARQLTTDKVVESPDKRFIFCSVGGWGMAKLLIGRFMEASKEIMNTTEFIAVDLRDVKADEFDGEVLIIDRLLDILWMFDESVNGFGRLPLEPFVIGHSRATAVVGLKLLSVDDSKWTAIASDLEFIAGSALFNDRVTAPPYKVLSVKSLSIRKV